MARPHVQVILADQAMPKGLRKALERTGAITSFWPLTEAVRREPSTSADALVLVLPEDTAGLARPLQALFDRLVQRPRATLVMTTGGPPKPSLRVPPRLPVTCAYGLDEEGLWVRLSTMLELRESLKRACEVGVAGDGPARGREAQHAARQYMSQLRLASRVQRGLLPEALPRFGPVRFHVLFRPVEYVSGDIYDVQRLDDVHVGIALADASGHGIPAALLTVFIKRALRGKHIDAGGYRILKPDEVLRALNADILEARLTDCPFVAAAYAVLNTRRLSLSLARAGAPYPIYRHADGRLQRLDPPGTVVGVLPDPAFGVRSVQLEPGDSVLFYSDGLERILGSQPESSARAADGPVAGPDGLGLANVSGSGSALLESEWASTLRAGGLAAALEELSGRQRTLRRMGYPLDDLTVLAVQIDQPATTVTTQTVSAAQRRRRS